jgi:hypothetical protein
MADISEMRTISAGIILLLRTQIQSCRGHYRTESAVPQISSNISLAAPFCCNDITAPNQFCSVHPTHLSNAASSSEILIKEIPPRLPAIISKPTVQCKDPHRNMKKRRQSFD